MDIEITIAPNYAMFGFTWFSSDEDYPAEFNIYLLCIEIKFIF